METIIQEGFSIPDISNLSSSCMMLIELSVFMLYYNYS